eukprot:GFYU01013914.1.p1 GENE.GFYU01013914.1~~GFYU01013914.1.p1  ORF type:complete len:361 (+),score=51.43 GFYU01013914.1:131-1213(+)
MWASRNILLLSAVTFVCAAFWLPEQTDALTVTSPDNLKGKTLKHAVAQFGARPTNTFTGEVVGRPGGYCNTPSTEYPSLQGKIFLINAGAHGHCNYSKRVLNAQIGGASGVIIYNGDKTNDLWVMSSSDEDVEVKIFIPAYTISDRDGLQLDHWYDLYGQGTQKAVIIEFDSATEVSGVSLVKDPGNPKDKSGSDGLSGTSLYLAIALPIVGVLLCGCCFYYGIDNRPHKTNNRSDRSDSLPRGAAASESHHHYNPEGVYGQPAPGATMYGGPPGGGIPPAGPHVGYYGQGPPPPMGPGGMPPPGAYGPQPGVYPPPGIQGASPPPGPMYAQPAPPPTYGQAAPPPAYGSAEPYFKGDAY